MVWARVGVILVTKSRFYACRTEIARRSKFDFARAKVGFFHETTNIDLKVNSKNDQNDEN